MKKHGYYISFAGGSTVMVRVPTFKQENFPVSKLDEAIRRRDELCRLIDRDPYANPNNRNRQIWRNHADKFHPDLPPGITRVIKNTLLASGVKRQYVTIHATAAGQLKRFGTLRRGEALAIKLAVEWRKRVLLQHGLRFNNTPQKHNNFIKQLK